MPLNIPVTLFFMPFSDLSPAQQQLATSYLSADEIAKVQRYRTLAMQNQALQVRAALRLLLSRFADIPPQAWQFELGPQGKPDLCQAQKMQTGLVFNVSHSGNWLMIGIAQSQSFICADLLQTSDKDKLTSKFEGNILKGNVLGTSLLEANQFEACTPESAAPEVNSLEADCSENRATQSCQLTHAPLAISLGVDIERARASTHIFPILNHYFCAQESAALQALEDEACQRQRFFDLWALKESYIKATGLGLAQSLKSFAFECDTSRFAELAFVLDGAAPVNELNWRNKMTNTANSSVAADAVSLASAVTQLVDVKLVQLEACDERHWQVQFGRLDAQYRFAVSLSAADTVAPLCPQLQFISLADALRLNT